MKLIKWPFTSTSASSAMGASTRTFQHYEHITHDWAPNRVLHRRRSRKEFVNRNIIFNSAIRRRSKWSRGDQTKDYYFTAKHCGWGAPNPKGRWIVY